jgi:hypothetical protein
LNTFHFEHFSFLFRGSEEHQYLELLLDVIEPVFEFSLDENDGTGAHLGIVGADLHAGAASDYVVQLIFAMRFLGIGAALRQNVDAGAHGRDAQEFEIQFAFGGTLAGEIVDVEEVGHTFFLPTVGSAGRRMALAFMAASPNGLLKNQVPSRKRDASGRGCR